MLYQIPKNPGILFSKIPGSGLESNPGIPGYPGIPLGPGGEYCVKADVLTIRKM